jgi:hypothetical protein
MATRRRSSGFSTPEEKETTSIQEFLEDSSTEMFETILITESVPEEKTEVEETPVPEVPPTESVKPEVVETTTPTPPVVKMIQTSPPQPVQKRHPRNVPKFSRHK